MDSGFRQNDKTFRVASLDVIYNLSRSRSCKSLDELLAGFVEFRLEILFKLLLVRNFTHQVAVNIVHPSQEFRFALFHV